ncbi:sugar phosphate isomerase/epimerase family protein [Paenibacillus sp. MBLB4367]|uniref:sugar phosphate isomerase/epimerase family protein n=1 Tax=Paenibacillus sp. MBLB4367 TaxID=3384767 RepID=UPI003908148D
MLFTGLVSVTFRQKSPEEIIALVAKAGLDAIEWGGDVHVPAGNLERAREIGQATRDAGLTIASYGSYYRAGCGQSFADVLETAKALGAPSIRIWAGNKGTDKADEEWWRNVAGDARAAAASASAEGIRIAFEFHANTLTDGTEQTLRLLERVGHESVSTYWQHKPEWNVTENVSALDKLSSQLSNVHVFHWEPGVHLPLEEGIEPWRRYIDALEALNGDRFLLMEFVKDGEEAQFLEDAAVLKKLTGRDRAHSGS